MEGEIVRYAVMIIAGKIICIYHHKHSIFTWFIFTWILLAISYCIVP